MVAGRRAATTRVVASASIMGFTPRDVVEREVGLAHVEAVAQEVVGAAQRAASRRTARSSVGVCSAVRSALNSMSPSGGCQCRLLLAVEVDAVDPVERRVAGARAAGPRSGWRSRTGSPRGGPSRRPVDVRQRLAVDRRPVGDHEVAVELGRVDAGSDGGEVARARRRSVALGPEPTRATPLPCARTRPCSPWRAVSDVERDASTRRAEPRLHVARAPRSRPARRNAPPRHAPAPVELRLRRGVPATLASDISKLSRRRAAICGTSRGSRRGRRGARRSCRPSARRAAPAAASNAARSASRSRAGRGEVLARRRVASLTRAARRRSARRLESLAVRTRAR